MTIYLDCNATTPLDPEVREAVLRYMEVDFGNAGSRTHEYGTRAKQAVQRARDQVASVVGAKRDEVLFTSGATEANNLALLGLARHGEESRRKHVLSTRIEHKAVLEPLEELERRGFEVELLEVTEGGWVDPERVRGALRDDTLLVSVMAANNETGVLQPIEAIAEAMEGHPVYFHVDAAQAFGKVMGGLRSKRVDLMSVSGHKVYGPKGVGALVMRRRGFEKAPLSPLLFGGGQERGLRPGTLPVPLIVGLGVAAEVAAGQGEERRKACQVFRARAIEALAPLGPQYNGDQERVLPHVVNLSVPGVNSEAAIVAVKSLVAISNGSACTSQSYTPSHVLEAMGLGAERVQGALRISWCHLTEEPDWDAVVGAVQRLQ